MELMGITEEKWIKMMVGRTVAGRRWNMVDD